VESLNRSLRKIIKTRGGFPNQEEGLKLLFLALRQAAKKWTMPIHHWREALPLHDSVAGTDASSGQSGAMTTPNASTSHFIAGTVFTEPRVFKARICLTRAGFQQRPWVLKKSHCD
jgi:hypothetical protein